MEPTTVARDRGPDPHLDCTEGREEGTAPVGGRPRSPTPAGRRTGVVCVLGSASNRTNVELVRRWNGSGLDAVLLSPPGEPPPGAVVLGRIDVLPTLDGIEPGLGELRELERRGVVVLNRAAALLAVHDKLLTARRLEAAGLPHPRTLSWSGAGEPPLPTPFVLKPRFGSWGRDVLLCRNRLDLARSLELVASRPWFLRHGVLVQEVVPSPGYDLRLLVAGGEVVGACERIAAPGEWRTNVSLGGTRRRVAPPPEARALAAAAAAELGTSLAGVDLIPLGADRYVVLELNGAVEFDDRYSLGDGDVFVDAARALGLASGPGRA